MDVDQHRDNPMGVVRLDLGRDRAQESGPSPGTGVNHFSVANLKSQACAHSALIMVTHFCQCITLESRFCNSRNYANPLFRAVGYNAILAFFS